MGGQRGKSKVSRRQNAKAETLDCLLLKNWEFCESEKFKVTNSMGDPSLDSMPSLWRPWISLAECSFKIIYVYHFLSLLIEY